MNINAINEYVKSCKSQQFLAEQFGVNKTRIQQTIKHKAEYMTAFEENASSTCKCIYTCLNSDELEATV